MIAESGDVEALALQVSDSDGVHFVPAFTGLGAPYWDPQARGALVGLTRGTTAAHIARATLEAMAFQNALLMQFQADLLGAPVVCAQHAESTALGAAALAAVGLGIWSESDVAAGWQAGTTYLPRMSRDEAASRLQRWARAVASTRSFQ